MRTLEAVTQPWQLCDLQLGTWEFCHCPLSELGTRALAVPQLTPWSTCDGILKAKYPNHTYILWNALQGSCAFPGWKSRKCNSGPLNNARGLGWTTSQSVPGEGCLNLPVCVPYGVVTYPSVPGLTNRPATPKHTVLYGTGSTCIPFSHLILTSASRSTVSFLYKG